MRFAQAVRQHWGVENSLHWVLDVSFQEDACRIRKEKGAQTFAVLRHIAINLLRREPHHKRGIKARRKRAGWDRDYLVQVLTGKPKCACPGISTNTFDFDALVITVPRRLMNAVDEGVC